MKKFSKRSLAWLASLMLFISLLASLVVLPAEAATVTYVKDGKYVYNWGQRDELATFLSPMAEDWYDENNAVYDQLAALSGSSNTGSVPDSELYEALHTLMYENLDNPTSYDATRSLFKYTDCENSGGSISSFYSGKAIGPAWDSGSTWNREHTWPNSRSNGKSDTNTQRETDIMMLRPASVSENGSRSNIAYGESSKFYDPNELGQNVRGDAARIVLYVYVCWGGSSQHDGALNYMWGSNGVMESKEVLLKWMEEDPVDTWELGRNDSVESITGTRNVFVDYPELAFLLFNEDVPADYDSPSGEKVPAVGHNYVVTATIAPTCDKAGVRTYTCTDHGETYTEAIPATGHKMVNGICSVCGLKQQNVTFKLGADGTASHNDGTGATTYTETVDGYTLSIVSGVKMYSGARDAQGNGCIKLGTGSAVGSFSFTVPKEVSSVVIHIAKYKSNAANIQVNGVAYTLSNNSNDGKYDAIEVNTSVDKTISLTTVSGSYRAMVNAIDYVMSSACEHAYDNDCDASCNECGATREVGEHVYTNACDTDCNECGATRQVGDHVYDDANDATCNECGAVRAIAARVLAYAGASISEDVAGLAFRFNAYMDGVKVNGNVYVTNSASVVPYVGGESYSVVRMGAVVSNKEGAILELGNVNDTNIINVEAVHLWGWRADAATFAVRITNIPDNGKDSVITARPYYVYEVDGEEIVIYGDAVSKTYNQIAR